MTDTNRKTPKGRLLAVAAAVAVMTSAGAASAAAIISVDQHFKVKNRTGQHVKVTIVRANEKKKDKGIDDGKTETLKFNNNTWQTFCEDPNSKICVRQATVYWKISTEGKDGRKTNCEFTIIYHTNSKGTSLKNRTLNATCANVSFSNVDGKTADVKLN